MANQKMHSRPNRKINLDVHTDDLDVQATINGWLCYFSFKIKKNALKE